MIFYCVYILLNFPGDYFPYIKIIGTSLVVQCDEFFKMCLTAISLYGLNVTLNYVVLLRTFIYI